MKKVLGILILLIVVCLVTAVRSDSFLKPINVRNNLQWTALYGVISIGVSFVIITGGIDLSIGAVIGLIGSLLPFLLVKHGFSTPAALATVTAVAASIGLLHGLLITRLKLQPFVVTLCGLLCYRGLARWLTGDATQSFAGRHDSLRELAKWNLKLPLPGGYSVPAPFLIMLGLAVLASVLLNRTVAGRRLLALGRNEQAARYSGINTGRLVILAYMISSLCAALGGVLFALDLNSVEPASFGDFYELYAIAAAVLGGCSLRGGEGSILGVIIGAALIRVLLNAINLLGIPTQLEFAIIGMVILMGVIADELVKRLAARRRALAQARS